MHNRTFDRLTACAVEQALLAAGACVAQGAQVSWLRGDVEAGVVVQHVEGADAAALIAQHFTVAAHGVGIQWRSGELVRIACTEADAKRAVAELSANRDVVAAWHEVAAA